MERSPVVVSIKDGDLTAEVSDIGAELRRLTANGGQDYLWNGDPAYWSGRAPLLFPMVGRALGDRIRVDGRYYPMAQHGFARASRFQIAEVGKSHCIMTLAASKATLAQYPFLFRLDVEFRLVERKLSIAAKLFNEGSSDLPASFGFHPAFRWPLPGSEGREGHALIFDQDEPASLRRLDGGMLTSEAVPSPLRGRRLELSDGLFDHGALVFDQLNSRRVTYVGPQGQKIDFAFPDMPHLGVWTKPGAGFVCVEPWQGFASPVGFDSEFQDKPGVVQVAPGSSRLFELVIEVGT